MAEVEYLNPRDVPAPSGAYSHLAKAGGLVFLSGQVGVDEKDEVVPGGVEAQTVATFDNIATLLATQGIAMNRILKLTSFVVGAGAVAPFLAGRTTAYSRHFPDGVYPPNSLVVVEGLVDDELLIEIDVVAAA